MANNQGDMRDVLILAWGAGGPIGLGLGLTKEQGPCLMKDIEVLELDFGIALRDGVDSVTVSGEKQVALLNDGLVTSLRHFKSENAVPPAQSVGAGVVVMMLDSDLVGTCGAPEAAAVSNRGGIFLRDVRTCGYASAVEDSAGGGKGVPVGDVSEWTSHPVLVLFPTAVKSLNLPIEDTPEIAFEAPEKWVNVIKFGLPEPVILGTHENGKEIHVENWIGPLQRVIGCEAEFGRIVASNRDKTVYQDELVLKWVSEDGDGAVIIERFNTWYASFEFLQKSKPPLVVSSLSFYDPRKEPGSGDILFRGRADEARRAERRQSVGQPGESGGLVGVAAGERRRAFLEPRGEDRDPRDGARGEGRRKDGDLRVVQLCEQEIVQPAATFRERRRFALADGGGVEHGEGQGFRRDRTADAGRGLERVPTRRRADARKFLTNPALRGATGLRRATNINWI